MNRTLIEMARSMLSDAGLPNTYWGDAILHAAWIVNRIPTRALEGDITPYKSFYGVKPSLANLRIFGCKAYVHIPDEKRRKLDAKSLECVFIGFTPNKSGYRLLHRNTGRVLDSRDVFFDEGQGIRDRVRLELDPTPSPSPPAAEPAPLKTETPKDEDSEDDDQVEAILDDSDQESDHTPPQPLPPPPPEPRRSTRSHTAPICDNNDHYFVSPY